MLGAVAHHSSKERLPKPLVVRAGLSRTFGSLAGFAALLFLALGIYLLADAFAHPVDAQAAALIVAALALALAALLLFFLFKQRRTPEMFRNQTFEDSAPRPADAPSRAPSVLSRQDDRRKDLAYQRVYVDRSRIRP
jgi:hypothetical protein